MTSARILRWKGGYAGDMVMYLMHLSGYKIANVNFLDEISESGRVLIDFDKRSADLSNLDRIARDSHHIDSVDHDRLVHEIEALGSVWIKSHYYHDCFDHITTDITVDTASLPFVMSANVYKTHTLKTQLFHPLADRIKDNDVKLMLALYHVAKDTVDTTSVAISKISVSDMLQGWETLCAKLDLVDIHLDAQAEPFYQTWYHTNQKYFAGARYMESVKNKDYNHNQPGLSMSERYALMVLQGEKFQILQHPEEVVQ